MIFVVQEKARSAVSPPIGQAHVEPITPSLPDAGVDTTQNVGGDPALAGQTGQTVKLFAMLLSTRT